jgi:NADH pyrophosphatase NudC (nudix superfamily)
MTKKREQQHAPAPDYRLGMREIQWVGVEQLCALYPRAVDLQFAEDTLRICPDCGDEMAGDDPAPRCINCAEDQELHRALIAKYGTGEAR